MKKVLVTGARGFIGRQCVPLLVSKGYEIHGLSRGGPEVTTNPHVIWHQIDLLRPGCAAELISKVRPDCVLHLAWYAEPEKFWEAKENLDWVRASLELLRAFAENGGKRIVVAGSCAEYGRSTGECVENATLLLPTTLYGTSKHSLERMLHASTGPTGLSSAWGRIFFLYGPHEHPSRLVASVVRSLLQAEPAFCSEGRQTLDFLHVEDAASAFIALLESEVQGPVNIGSGHPVAVRNVVQEIGRQLGRLELIRFGSRPASSEAEGFWANTQRLAKEIAWAPHYSLSSGIEQTIEWWRSAGGISAGGPIQLAGQ